MLAFLHPEAEFAWAVGLWEGEGTICAPIQQGQVYRRLKIAVIMSDRDVLEKFQQVVGFGNLNGPYQYKNSKKPLYSWNSGRSAEVAMFARRMLPYLSERRALQVMTALDGFNSRQMSRNYSTPKELV